MLDHYLTIREEGQHEINVQKSRFICTIARAYSEEEAQSFIAKIKKEYWNATHNCSAYLIGDRSEFQKASDDGEPIGTAGIPMLEVLKKKNLQNIVVLVTRYFGGTKLGAGGLIRAYGSAVSEACHEIGIVERILATLVSFTVSYSQLGKFENALAQKNYSIADKQFTDVVTLSVFVDEDDIDPFLAWMTEVSNGQIHCTLGEKKYYERDVSQ
ncbi:YigZ family protein [Listeria aquatica]|uniref:YigZ family protein n=1 Tax=Listeria aquatica TaxID=1494960 RepID=A0A841ZNB4_9LIST|nr:YigZ family protein [Listeria aquatica]MBC1521846.1 YigZ family protein [Listeria aquatica]